MSFLETEEEFQRRLKKIFSNKEERRWVRATLRTFPNIAAQNKVVEILSLARSKGMLKEAVEKIGEAWSEFFGSQNPDVCGDPAYGDNLTIWYSVSEEINKFSSRLAAYL